MSTPTSKDELLAATDENRTRQQAMIDKERWEAGEGTIKLISAADDPALFSPEYQTEFRGLLEKLRSTGLKIDTPFMTMDSPGAGGGYIGEVVVPLLQFGSPFLGAILGAWVQAKFGRKIRIKAGDVEVETPDTKALTTEEVKKLLQDAIEASRQPKQ